MSFAATSAATPASPSASSTRIGIDLVQVSAIAQSIADFGPRFTTRLFAAGELRAATIAGALDAGRLAQRFAAKEAAIKAFELAEAGVGWADIEVEDDGAAAAGPTLARIVLHGRAAESAARLGAYDTAASLSIDGDLACAIVVARGTANP